MQTLANILADWSLWALTDRPLEPHQIKPLSGGLTNICYHLMLDSGDYILRINAANTTALGINREREEAIHQLAADHEFTSKMRYCAADHSYCVRDYIVGEVLAEEIKGTGDVSDRLLSHLVETLKSLHQLPITLELPTINISDAAESYWQMLETNNPNDELLKMKPLMQVAMQEPPAGSFCLCHMDPVLANWLYTATGLQLLDWEYAGLGHPLWDLAAFVQSIKAQLGLEIDNKDPLLAVNPIESIEEKIITLYGVTDLIAWRRAKLQMEYLSSLWYRAQR
jgi:thiamine kinase-like enzyme